jgi:peptidoglycan/xylan/chitin deacetylase (PgdA/CDA1 family)
MRAGAVCLFALVCMSTAAVAAECPGNPDALGTSRVIVVDPTEHTRVGTMQYREMLPLEDHEVVLTFDDGPLPTNTNRILQTLASECVKATYFLVGRMAQAHPDMVRQIHGAGHTIGTHSQTHPLTFNRMPLANAEQEINDGIGSVTTALGASDQVAPFFRIPGLMRAEQVEDYLASRGIMTWSADFPADDWHRRISSAEIVKRALTRLEARGKGVLLLHDIKPATAAALPVLLKELKLRGYRIVHVVPASTDLQRTATLPSQWLMHPARDPYADLWPRIAKDIPDAMASPRLATPSLLVFGIGQPVEIAAALASPVEQPRAAIGKTRAPQMALWPRHANAPSILDLVSREELPVPNPESFGYSSVPAQPAVPRKRAAAMNGSPAFADLPEPARRGVDITSSIGPRPGNWPVTTASMPRSGFP